MKIRKRRRIPGYFFLFLWLTAAILAPLGNGMAETERFTVIVDAGHGGEDGGAVAKDGTVEKDLNLAVALLLKASLEEAGITVLMTRSEDDDTDGLSGFHKRKDLEARAALGNESGADLYVSIHMNASRSDKDGGFQVWYGSGNGDGQRAAERISTAVEGKRICNRIRAVKQVPETLYIFRTLHIPNVLVECGFLSNGADLQKLRDENFQKELTEALCKGICDYLSGISSEIT